MKYTLNEMQIMNLADHYTLLYAFLGKSLLEQCGEKGEQALREGTRRFGRDRAEALRARHLDANVKINMHSLFAVGADLPPDPRFKRELQELNPQERVSHTLYCPMAALWKEYGVMEIGRIYCEEFHRACYGHYAFGYTKVNLAKTQAQPEDEYCAFNVVLRPETLPEELRAVCFEEYDPEYSGPVKQLAQAQGKSGFGTLFIKLYFHIAQAAEDILGDMGRSAVCKGMEDMAEECADRLLCAAREQGKEMSLDFIEANYPLRMDMDGEPLWSIYGSGGWKEEMKNHFCNKVQRICLDNGQRLF